MKTARIRSAISATVSFLAIIWIIQFINFLSGMRLTAYGIHPLTPEGLVGIILAPFLHADFGHLMANSSIALIVVFLVALSGRRVLWLSSIVIALVAGIGTWLFGGSGTVHIGASGVIFGWLTFLIVRGLFTRQLLQILLGGVVLFSYGSVLWGVLPTTPGVSWQGHLFGAIGGLVAAWLVGRRNLMAGMRVASV
ncbi:rhomboid family intramembrane serine protease [Corynebacterium auriscanis]|uniref:rhomboid family intramembrane serine protease n=1 Tax=Corynebacterium auriscanis TaxID=99807 RepID=UPI0025B4B949|nr:rhomboid family intramembrane serine protease [Corynebacterium auriscanis]WJY72261.1 Rhomboid family protein [Corynebacterium auriscanis]